MLLREQNHMFIELLRVVFFAAVPVCIISYLLISGAKRKQRLATFYTKKDLDAAHKQMLSDYKKNKKQANSEHKKQLVLNKWMYFGGGFYGLMALSTYAVIEVKEVYAYCIKLFDLNWSQVFSSFSISMLVDLLVNAILNIVDAFLWFIYWPKHVHMMNGWYWLLAAYLGYLLGAKLVQAFPRNYSLLDLFRFKS